MITLSCSLENEAVHQHEHSKKASYQRKMYDELILDKNFSKAIKQIPKKNVLASTSLNRTVMEEQYGFTIFDVPINVMETDSVISYNLCIETDSLEKGDFFENLVINSNKFTNTIDAYLVKYNLLSEITPSAHGSFSFDFEPEIKPINYDASTARAFTWCYSYHYEMCHELVPGTQFESPHTPTEACNQQSLIYTHTETRCIVIGESGGTGDSGAFESPSSGTSGQSSGPYNNGQSSYGNNTVIINPNPLTGPTPTELKRIREQCFLNTFLSTTQSNWLKSPANAQTRNAIYDYLATQTNYGSGDDFACYPNEAMEFAEELIDLAIEYLNSYGNSTENQNFISSIINDILNPENDEVEPEDIDIDPNCESFNFQQTSSNWQESAVTNIRFRVIIVSPDGLYVNHVVEFPQAVLFGCPINLSIGDTYISPGLAANVSAQALEQAMDETVKKFGNKSVTSMVVELYFKQRLKHNYPLFIPGARVNFNPSSYSVTPSPYQSSFGNGDCN